jgi:hypothetical protein
MVNSEELIGNTEYMASQKRCHINRHRYNRVRPYTKITQEGMGKGKTVGK